MRPESLVFALLMADAVLARDLGVLMRCGVVQARAVMDNADNPAGWFRRAADTYEPTDAAGALAWRACVLTAYHLASEAAS